MTRQPERIAAALALAAALLAAGAACPASPDARPEPTDAAVRERLAAVESSLEGGQAGAAVWWGAWIGIQGGSAVAYSALAIADPDGPDTPVNAVNAGVSAVGTAMLLAMPMVPAYAPRRIRQLPEDTPAARRAKLAAAEEWLRKSAECEALGVGWLAHLINFGVAAAAGLVLSFAFERTDWRDGLYNFGLLFAVGELQIISQPTRAIRDWNAYGRRYRPTRPVEVTAFAAPGAAALSIRF